MGNDSAGTPSASQFGTGETAVGDSKIGNGGSGGSNRDAELPPGTAVGEYQIEEVIGRGGFGTVYRATQPVIGKRVAIKVLSRKYSADDEMVSRFKAEAKAVNQIRHRHIIDIFSFGELADGRQYYVMELLDGEPLDTYLDATGPLSLDQAIPILRAIARALDAAHAKGVAHRDLKPENIFLARDDEGAPFPKLLDFGIAKLDHRDETLSHRTNTGVPLGTPYYMSPEQCRGQGVDHRTDLYSFGVLVFRMLTGAFPFEGGLIEMLHRHMHEQPPVPSSKQPGLGPAVDKAIAWMLEKDPANRPPSAIAAVAALQDESTSTITAVRPSVTTGAIGPITMPGTTDLEVVRPPRGRWWIPLLAVAVVATAVVAFVATRRDSEPVEPVPPVAPAPQIAPPPSPDAAIAVTPDAAPVSDDVIITVTGVPEGTDVRIGQASVGTAPGPVQIPRGRRAILTFRADGYLPTSKEVAADKDQPLDVGGLKKKPRVRPSSSIEDRDEIPSVFGKEKR